MSEFDPTLSIINLKKPEQRSQWKLTHANEYMTVHITIEKCGSAFMDLHDMSDKNNNQLEITTILKNTRGYL